MKNFQDPDMKKIQDIPYQQIYSNGEDYILRTFSDEMNGGYGWHEFPLKKEDYEVYKKGERDAGELTFKAAFGAWPPKVTQEEANRIFLRDNVALLLNDADNQRLFTRAELEKVLPKGTEILASSDESV